MWKEKKAQKNRERCKQKYEMKKNERINALKQKCHSCGYSDTSAAKRKRKERKIKADKRLYETERKRKYRKTQNKDSAIHTINDIKNTFSNKMEKSRAVKAMKSALPTTPKKRVAVMATYLDNKQSPTVQSLEKLKFVVTPEEKTDIELGNAVLNDLKEIVDQAKFSRSDSARTALSVIVASTSGKNITKERKKTLLSRKLGLPLKRISKGKRVRTQIFSSEKSCWTYIERKTRKDTITDDVKKIAYNFWTDPNTSRPSGNKNDTKRIRIGPKQFLKHPIYILDKSQTEVFNDFCINNPNIKMNQRTFERLKPYFVRSARPKDRVTCCCRYHIEARTLFSKTMEFRKKYTIPNILDSEKNVYPIYEHLTDIAVATLCDKDQVNNSYSKACLDRECSKCGLSLLKFTDEELNVSDDAPNVSWERYEYITVNSKKKLTLVRKCTKPGEMFNYFRQLLEKFAGHQFRAQWQNAQLKCLKENLLPNHCIIIHDYSENYGCKEKFELQQTYFQRTEVSIHVSVIYRHAILEVDGIESLPDIPCIITEHFFVISPDEKHDQFFTQKVQTLVKEYLDLIQYDVKVIHEFTDGCPVQYKSRNCFGMLTDICSKHGYELFIRNYFETSHAKGPQDAAGGFLKNQVDMAVFRGKEIIQSADDFFKYCEKHLKDTKSLDCKRRIFRYVESIDRDTISFKPVPGIRSLHQVFSSLNDANLTVRYLSCYSCENCLVGTYKDCTNNSIGSKATIPIVVDNNRTRHSGPEESTENYEMEDLITLGTILAVYTDEADSNYYLFKADACTETLKKDTTDDWGVTYVKGSKVVRGLYFDQTKKLLSYKLLDKKHSIISIASVIYISPTLQCSTRGTVTLPETTHLDILSVLDEMEGAQ